MIRYCIGLIAIMVMSSFFVSAQAKKGKKDKVTKWIEEADTLAAQERYDEALTFYNKAVAKMKFTMPQHYDVLNKRAFVHLQLQQPEHALNDINRFLKHRDEPQGVLLRAYIYQSMGDLQNLIKDIDTLAAAFGDNLELLQWRTDVLMDLERYEEAKMGIKNLKRMQNNPSYDLMLAVTHFYMKEYDSAFQQFDQMIMLYPFEVSSYMYPSSLCLDEEMYDRALYYINKAMRYHAANPTFQFYKGIALTELKQEEEGCRFLRKAFYNGADDAAEYLKEKCFGQPD